MSNDNGIFNQIAKTLSKHFDSMYYVDIETGEYSEYVPLDIFEELGIPKQGDDFFADSIANAHKYVHPDDIELVKKIYDRDEMINRLNNKLSCLNTYRLIFKGRIIHMRYIGIMCDDNRHVLCCLENIEEEHKKKEEQERNLKSAERMARRDELTGIRNKNAFKEFSESVEEKIGEKKNDYHFAVVICDINDLKKLNDTRGHSFGDEAIQRASRMICEVYEHSPVFRIGGDEFVVLLFGKDYENRGILIDKLKEESIINQHSRSGPVVACGMAVYDPDSDEAFDNVFDRADKLMYENKQELKSSRARAGFMNMKKNDVTITPERKRLLDGLFGALYTVAGGGYVYLNDMKYDYSRWSLPLVDDFNMRSEYMYHADNIWLEHIHPDDLKVYREAVNLTLGGSAEVQNFHYRALRADGTYAVCHTRGFILSDGNGDPEYFGGIIIAE